MMKKVICTLLVIFLLTDSFAQQSMWEAGSEIVIISPWQFILSSWQLAGSKGKSSRV
jgi:hypothetical protein